MTQLTPIRLTLRLCVLALLLLAALPALAAPPQRLQGWQAVLVAGDNAEPVFDNGVAALSQWLTERGVPGADIHRLSARVGPGVEPATVDNVMHRIASLSPRPGQGCLVFLTSHGQRGEGVWLAASGEFLTPAELARALAGGCAQAPTVVIVSSCYSGAFTRLQAPNRIVMTAARADRPSFGCQADRTYTVFDECLLSAASHAADWRGVYAGGLGCVRQRERYLGVLPSQPQAAFGAAVRNLPLP